MSRPESHAPRLGMKELGERINAHLKRFESDSKINKPYASLGTKPYYDAHAAYCGGARVMVVYVSYQGQSFLTRAEADAYLAWLDAGNVGWHYEQRMSAK